MKKFSVSVVLLLITTTCYPQNYGFDVILRGGIALPQTPATYRQTWQAGPHLAAGCEFNLSRSVSMGLLAEYTRNDVKADGAVAGAAVSDARWSGGVNDMFSMAVFLDYRMAGRVAGMFPYVCIDAGVNHMKASQLTFTAAGTSYDVASSSETAFGAGGGLGIDIPMSANVCFSLTGKYEYAFTKHTATGFVPIDAGFKFVF